MARTLGERVTAVETDVEVLKKNKSELWDQFNAYKEKVNRMEWRILAGIATMFGVVEAIKAVVG